MVTQDDTANKLAVALEAPFGVHLNGILMAEHASADAALGFAERLRAGLALVPGRHPRAGANLDALDTVAARLDQATGVLGALWDAGAFDTMQHAGAQSSMWAAQELLEQAQKAVRSIDLSTV